MTGPYRVRKAPAEVTVGRTWSLEDAKRFARRRRARILEDRIELARLENRLDREGDDALTVTERALDERRQLTDTETETLYVERYGDRLYSIQLEDPEP